MLTHRRGRPRNRQIAGVLTFSTELRRSVTRQSPTLWLHPDPAQALPELPWQRAELAGAEIHVTPGAFDPAETFELPDCEVFPDVKRWPGRPFTHLRQ
jgi:hypothetical protein